MRVNSHWCRLIFLVTLYLSTNAAYTQGPDKAYFYNPDIMVPWATCRIYYESGSGFEIKFLPVISRKVLPLGMESYNDPVSVNGQIYLDPDGFIEDPDQEKVEEINNKILMFCYDLSDTFGVKSFFDLNYEKQIYQADSLGMQGVILYSLWDESPLFFYKESDLTRLPDIPVIVTNKYWAEKILTAAGIDTELLEYNPTKNWDFSQTLIVNADIRIKGFKKMGSDYMDLYYDPSQNPEQQMKRLIYINDSSIQIIKDILFPATGSFKWTKTPFVLFNNFDQQFFYSARKGYGISSDNLISVVKTSDKISVDLIIHENTHRYLYDNWGHSSSFMDEGVAKYVEAKATIPDINHSKCLQFLQENKILPFSNYLDADIGASGEITAVGYPLSGSFIDFIIQTYSLDLVYQLYQKEYDPNVNRIEFWQGLFGMDPDSLFDEWKRWLIRNHE